MSGLITRLSPSALGAFDAAQPAAFAAPHNYLAETYTHSLLDNYSVAMTAEKTVTHASLAGKAGTKYPSSEAYFTIVTGRQRATTTTLIAHGQPAPPRFAIAFGDEIIPSGTLVQSPGARRRWVSFFADATHIKVRDVALSDTNSLPAITITYKIIVYDPQQEDPAAPEFRATPARVIASRGKMDTDRPNMRVTADDESPFWISTIPLLDARGGAWRTITPRGTKVDEAGYDGNFNPALKSIQVKL